MSIRVGTASWTDKTLLACGRFYPPGVSGARDRLRFYASRFPMVEVDSSHYALPDPHVAYHWARSTPPGFLFNVKAFRLFTGHATPPAALPADIRRALGAGAAGPALYWPDVPAELRGELWRRFELALEPLRMAGKLGAVHFQYAPGVRPGRGRMLLDDAARAMREHTMAVEFRHASWFAGPQADATLALLRELNAVHVVVDCPQGPANTVPAVWAATRPDLAVVRLHGRNLEAWNRPAAASSGRFVYEYTPAELDELAAQVRRLARAVASIHVLFNTNFEDQGMRNAAAFRTALDAPR
ncbi:DUF72 domain-containing protein [Pigmentiphaga soli]|uniref:DUF72 domain-containing protein n=1 Tax=Pigmentiphaga soli TaxID=1007095 RepID=A0ABP8GVP1_9BURK